jgi:putative acetyltransferase
MATVPMIRPECPADEDAIREINRRAFDQPLEAELVDALREVADPFISLVAELEGRIVGHILFTAVTIGEGAGTREVLGLAPMAVHPDHQRQGVGSALVRHGLGVCQAMGYPAVIVLGHPGYYPRFGFRRASDFDVRFEAPVPDEAFMALELEAGALDEISGPARYHPLIMGADG